MNKKIYLFTALALATLFNANAQVVFNSSIESWSAGLPTDMYGAKSNIVADSVIQVTGSSDYGNNAARLKNTTTTHKRFTTQPLTVINTKTYEIKFWVKGQGDIRTGLFDGRATGFGYAPYNAYIPINSSTWAMQTQTITCENDTVAAEFILSTRNTVGPNHIMVDSVIISEVIVGPPADVSIYEIQYTTVGPSYISPYNTQTVNTGGIVTAFYFNGYFVQTGSGAWRGVEVYDTTNTAVAGDSVTFTATVEEYFTNTRLKNVTGFTIVSSGNPVPTPAAITTTTGNTEDFEGTLVNTVSVCTDDDNGFGMWTVYTSPDSLRIDDLMYSFTPVVGFTYDLTGCMSYNFGEYKLNPRKPSDVTVLGINENDGIFNSVSIYPNPSSTYVKIDNAPKGSLVSLVDLTGKTILSTNDNTVNIANLTNGVYLIKLTSNNIAKTFKLIVKH